MEGLVKRGKSIVIILVLAILLIAFIYVNNAILSWD